MNYKKKNYQSNYNSNYNSNYSNNYSNNNYNKNYHDGGYYKNKGGNYNANSKYIDEEEAFSKVLENKKNQEEQYISKYKPTKTGGEIIARIDIPKGKTSLKELLN